MILITGENILHLCYSKVNSSPLYILPLHHQLKTETWKIILVTRDLWMPSSAMHLLKAEPATLAFTGPCPVVFWGSPRTDIQIYWVLGPVFDHLRNNYFFKIIYLICIFYIATSGCGFSYYHLAPLSLSVFCTLLLGSGRPLRPQGDVSSFPKGEQTHSFSFSFYTMCSRVFVPYLCHSSGSLQKVCSDKLCFQLCGLVISTCSKQQLTCWKLHSLSTVRKEYMLNAKF